MRTARDRAAGGPDGGAIADDHARALRVGPLVGGEQCHVVALEATGAYWKPVWHVLEATAQLVLVTPGRVRAIPGRKSDMNDAAWLADLLAHGLIRGSVVPPGPIQKLRDLPRTRKQLGRQIAQHSLRLQKTLEDANLKIASLVSDLLGVSGRAILRGLIDGETDPAQLLALPTGQLRADPEQLRRALEGRMGEPAAESLAPRGPTGAPLAASPPEARPAPNQTWASDFACDTRERAAAPFGR